MKITKQYLYTFPAIVIIAFFGLWSQISSVAQAADTDFSNGITVDSIGDGDDANIGDNICDDGSGNESLGNCTLRAAIQEANSASGTQTINFNISGTPSFMNSGQSGYTIEPTSALPVITDVTHFNGYSQPGAQANTTQSPQPLNGILLIEIDGSSAGGGTNGFHFTGAASGSSGSSLRGLVINDFQEHGIIAGAQDIVIAGNYIGIEPDGSTDAGNGVSGATHDGIPTSNGVRLGGLDAADRNILSGNGSSGAFPVTDWVVQGNYIGLDATGTVAIPNATSDNSGALSVDACENALIGGTLPGAANVVSGNASHGVAPHDCPGTIIQGNLIGTDWTGQVAVPNAVGISISDNQEGSLIGGETVAARNIISGNILGGVITSAIGQMKVQGNYVGLASDGNTPIPNGFGILSADSTIFGGSVEGRNVVSANTSFNISVQGAGFVAAGAEISGNYIGTNAQGETSSTITNLQGEGIRISGSAEGVLIGGQFANKIAGNRGSGIAVRRFILGNPSLTGTPSDVAILGNEIFGNIDAGPIAGAEGLGIDLYAAIINDLSSQPLPADITADSYANLGPTVNDGSDADTGPNNYINFPVINAAEQNASALNLNLSLNATGSPSSQYRVEVFANDQADTSGYGEGQIYLGSVAIGPGANQNATITLPANTNLSGKSISATTTAMGATTNSGYGATSEFSLASAVTITALPQTPGTSGNSSSDQSLANAGQDMRLMIGVGLLLTVGSITTLLLKRRRMYRAVA